jgi:hypothetical protein
MDNPSSADGRRGQTTDGLSNESKSKESDGSRGNRNCDLLVMRFMKNSIVDNPIIVSTDSCSRRMREREEREMGRG